MIDYPELGKLGRLGNSLFQIASVIGIAKANNTECSFPEWPYNEYFENKLPRKGCGYFAETIEEKSFEFDETLFKLEDKNYHLKGYFQSEKYWENVREEVLKQFTFTQEIKDRVSKSFTHVFTKPVVAISVRRGDFVNNKSYYQVPISYYLSAYYKYFSDCNILIFTDDFNYCKLHFESLSNVYYGEKLKDIEQLCLMSMCQNFIISNSTFSWWGSYLSGSKNVIRPVKNFDALAYSEKDFWIPHWKIHDEKLDLKDTTFVIPVFFDHNDRRLNIMMTVGFLLKNFDTNIIIGEQGGREFEFMSKYVDYVNFDQMEAFHRTRMINDMVKGCKTGIAVNWDGDNICTPGQLYEAVNLIRNGADIAYPFDGCVARVPRYMFNHVIESLDVSDINIQKCMPKTFTSVGHAVIMKKESFIQAGMENENFVSWGPEDSERYDRFNTLQLRVKRVKGKMYHMDHFVGPNSSTNHPHFQQNNSEHYKVKSMKKDALENYVSTWPWKNISYAK